MGESIDYCFYGHCNEEVAADKLFCKRCFYALDLKHQEKARRACTALKTTGKVMNDKITEIKDMASELYEMTNGNRCLSSDVKGRVANLTRRIYNYKDEPQEIYGYGETTVDIHCPVTNYTIPKGCHVVITGKYKSDQRNILTDMYQIRKAYEPDGFANIEQFGNEVVWFQKPKEIIDLDEVKEVGLVIVDDHGWLDYGDIVYKSDPDDMVIKLKDPVGRMNYQEGQIVWLKDPGETALMTGEQLDALRIYMTAWMRATDDPSLASNEYFNEQLKALADKGVIPHGN